MGMGKAKKQKLNKGTVLFSRMNSSICFGLVKTLEIRTLNLANWLAA